MNMTVNEKLNMYSKSETAGVERAIQLQKSLGYPSKREVIHAIRNEAVVNCPITVDDVLGAEHVHGKPAAKLKGKTTAPANQSNRVINVEKSAEKNLTLYVDVMLMNNIPFLLSVEPLNLLLSSHMSIERNGIVMANTLLTHVNILKS